MSKENNRQRSGPARDFDLDGMPRHGLRALGSRDAAGFCAPEPVVDQGAKRLSIGFHRCLRSGERDAPPLQAHTQCSVSRCASGLNRRLHARLTTIVAQPPSTTEPIAPIAAAVTPDSNSPS